ncbi:uncharacterized protein [Procambarus clarkii]|uniref:uncharacterized protein n=1 Tax=Procambarus clarkii TaxID=6728 RepID=UPI003742BDCB
MEKTPMYSVVTPPHPCKRQWVAWVATGVSIISLVAACVTASVAMQQVDRVTELEERMIEMQSHMEDILKFTLSRHDFLEYEDDPTADSQLGTHEELTIQRVLRRKREAALDDNGQAPVPIYEQAYGVDLKGRSRKEGLRLYSSLMDTQGEGDPTSPEVTIEATDSPIKPHHRTGLLDPTGSIVWPLKEISNLWSSPKRSHRYEHASGPQISSRIVIGARDDADDYIDNALTPQRRRRPPVVERRSRTKSLHSSGRRVRLRQRTPVQANTKPVPVMFRNSLVKATDRHDGFSGQNSVVPKASRVPQPPTVVEVVQRPGTIKKIPESLSYPRRSVRFSQDTKKKPRKKVGHGQRRRQRTSGSLAHFEAAPSNRTSRHGYGGRQIHEEWSPAVWMDKLGLNRKYTLNHGKVTVREAGLYYLYAQVLYESGRLGTGFQILVDDIPIMECTLAPTQPSHSCHTAGATYLPKNAAVYIKDVEQYTTPVRRHENTFFGLLKLMDAPNTAEELVLG